MDAARGPRVWLAALTVALTLTLVFLAVEKHLRLPTGSYFRALHSVERAGASTAHRGIVLTVDPGLAGVAEFPPADRVPLTRKESSAGEHVARQLLRRPPEPAANVVLQAPIALETMASLPLHSTRSKIDYLMEAMDHAFQSPMQTASAQSSIVESNGAVVPSFPINADRLAASAVPTSLTNRLPQPQRLIRELAELTARLEDSDAPSVPGAEHLRNSRDLLISRTPRLSVASSERDALRRWLVETRSVLDRLIVQHGLEHPASAQDLAELARLSQQAQQLGNASTDLDLSRSLLSASYSLERRVAVWQSLQQCLGGTSIALVTTRDSTTARSDLIRAIAAVDQKLGKTGDTAAWRTYLMLEELTAWSTSQQDNWHEGNNLALLALSRLHWTRLSESQRRFLAQPEFEELGAHLLIWGREAIDYRQLLTQLETFEEQPIDRVSGQLAGAIQVLRLSRVEPQQQLASALNDHYRNANLRFSISQSLIQRLVPSDQTDWRPVRQNILGADTSGDSTVHTRLRVGLVPDPNAWHIEVGVMGDVFSTTRSTKGPAEFHNTSTAQIDSNRYVRFDTSGYHVSSAPTSVASQDHLRQMRTDFDSLPIIGDLARFLVREQFDQKRGLAKRITQRIIAREADAELDRRLSDSLTKAERELSERIVGPLERLNLNPLVVSMNTTEDRLGIRYRVANEAQLAANTPRPRAPSDSLLSMQLHQSAINNTIEQMGLSGRLWTVPELYEHLGTAFQGTKWKLPEDVGSEVAETRIRFADTRPATVELVDGKLRLTLRIAEFSQGDRFHIERFIVTSTYVPVADGMSAELIRDGVVEIVSNHDRLKLRVIFAKVFVSNPQIPLISESWGSDSRSAGLAVSQVEIRDGWLSVAVSEAQSERAAEVTARAQQLRSLK